MVRTMSGIVVGTMVMILFFRHQIPIQNFEFWPMLALFFASTMFFFEWLMDIKQKTNYKKNHNKQTCLAVLFIWGMCAQMYFRADLIYEAVFNLVAFFIFLTVYMVASFFEKE